MVVVPQAHNERFKNSRAFRDLVVISCAVPLLITLAGMVEVYGGASARSHDHTRLVIDGLLVTGVIIAAAFGIFCLRRWKELRREMLLRKLAEGELKGLNGELEALVAERTAQLSSTNERMQAIIAAIGDGITIHDTDYRILYQNRIMTALFGDRTGEPCYRVYHGTDVVCDGCPVTKSFEDGGIHAAEMTVPTLKGVRTFENIASPLRNGEGEIIAGIEVVRDVTEQKRVAVALRKSEERFALFMQNLPGVAFIKDTEGRYLYVNEAWKRTFHRERTDDWCDKTNDEIWDPVTAQLFKENEGRVVAGRQPLQTVEPVLYPDGETYWLVSRFPLLNENGEPFLVGGVAIDVTHWKEAERALQESEERFRLIFEKTAIGIALVNLDGRPFACNLALQEMLGYREEELCAMRFDEFTHPSDIEEDMKCIREIAAGIRDHYQMEKRYVHKSGSIVWGRLIVTRVRGGDGRTRFVIGMVEDITDAKRKEEELGAYQQQLASLAAELSISEERERRRFASELHDQVGQTLAFAKIKLNTLVSDSLPPDCIRAITEVRDAVAQSIQEVRSLTFQISPPVLYEIGLEAAMEWLCEWFQEKHGFRVVFRHNGSPRPLDEEVRGTLFQVVRELLINVVKHGRTNDASIAMDNIGGELMIVVEDAGAGFDVSSVGQKRVKNGGFGLFNIRQRINHMGGELGVASAVGEGTRVTILVPLPGQRVRQTGESMAAGGAAFSRR